MTASQPHDQEAEDRLFSLLRELGVATDTHEHAAVFSVAEARTVETVRPGAHSKNLFLKDKKGRLFLVVAENDTAIDLKRLHEVIGASGRLSFGSGEQLQAALGVRPGSVTPFAALNDRDGRVTVILDARLMGHAVAHFHPLRNTASTAIAPDDLLRFLRATGHEPTIVTLPAPEGPR